MFLQHFTEIFTHRFRNQILATLTVQTITLIHGIGLGVLSPMLHLLQSPQTPLDFVVTVEDASWIGALFGLGGLFGTIVFGLLLGCIGRKVCLHLLPFPYMIFLALLYFAKTVIYLYVARFMGGVTCGALYIVIPIYLSEISDANVRGTLSSMMLLFLSFGIFFGYLMGTYINYFLIPCIIIILPIVYSITMTLFPETPQFLIKKERLEEAEESYRFYNNIKETDKTTLEAQEMSTQFEQMKMALLKGAQSTPVAMGDVFNPKALLSFMTCFVLIMVNQFSGNYAFINYTSIFFAESGSTMDPNESSIIIGVVQILGTLTATILIDRNGRKILMLISTLSMAAAMIALGVFTHLLSKDERAGYSWVPLVLMIIIMYVASFGVLALPFTIIVEIVPAKIRSHATAVFMALLAVLVFISLKVYPYFIYDWGISYTMFFNATICVICAIYFMIFLPETKGKSMEHD